MMVPVTKASISETLILYSIFVSKKTKRDKILDKSSINSKHFKILDFK